MFLNSTEVLIPYQTKAHNVVSIRYCSGNSMSLPFPHAHIHYCDFDRHRLFVCASKMTALNECQNFIVSYCKLHGERETGHNSQHVSIVCVTATERERETCIQGKMKRQLAFPRITGRPRAGAECIITGGKKG